VGYISAHGTSTQQNDADETTAIKLAFGDHARRLAVSSQKSMTGHTIGGAGAIECVTTALSLYHGVLTPTINYEVPDKHCDLDYVPNQPREAKDLKVAISNSFGFGGHNSTLVLEKA
jgi:3-oxoacyl-[acyl-carrier-protein] synthase II